MGDLVPTGEAAHPVVVLMGICCFLGKKVPSVYALQSE